MAEPHRSEDSINVLVREGRLRPATQRLRDVLAERGPLTGPVTDAGTRALLAVRGDEAGDGDDRR
jgi:hypothetical protein